MIKIHLDIEMKLLKSNNMDEIIQLKITLN